MRQSELVLVLGLATSLGCAPRPERVSIDLSAVPRPQVEAPPIRSTVIEPGPGPVVAKLPDLPARNVFVGSGQELAERAVAEARKNQEAAYRQALEQLRAAYRAEATSEQNDLLSSRRRLFEARYKGVYEALRTLFEEHADKVGPLWTRLSVLRGFPVPPGKARPTAEATFFGRDENKEAEELKKQIAALDLEYRTEVGRRVEALRHEWRGIHTELEAGRIVALDAAEQRAIDDARKLVTDILKGLEQSMIKDVQRLPAIPGATVRIDGLSVRQPQFPDRQSVVWAERDRLKRRAGLFARVSGYRLVDAAPGVKDVTKEFLEWDARHTGR